MKYFVVSDIHSFYSIFKEALENSGFENGNPNHTLIICGDLFDRGEESSQLLHHINRIENKILVRGNHEDLMLEMIERGYPESHDISNGTFKTAKQLAWNKELQEIDYTRLSAIFDYLISSMLDYYETDKYIFVHGWIPVVVEDKLPSYYTKNRKFSFDKNWRTGDWSVARWLNGIDMNAHGLNADKTIVCGHWHCSYGYHLWEGSEEFGNYAIWEPFKKEGIIAIDRCTAYTKEMNVLVLEDDLLDRSK